MNVGAPKMMRFNKQAVNNQDLDETYLSFIEKIKHTQDESSLIDDVNLLMQKASALIGCFAGRQRNAAVAEHHPAGQSAKVGGFRFSVG